VSAKEELDVIPFSRFRVRAGFVLGIAFVVVFIGMVLHLTASRVWNEPKNGSQDTHQPV
jgi:hypothetical protein